MNSGHDFVYDHFRNHEPSFDYVNIHWPEAIFDWEEPTEKDLKELENRILDWKKYSVLIYTKHDYLRNKGTTPNFTRLFDLVSKHADVFIHLGNFSRRKYEKEYPGAAHKLIYHPLFKNTITPTSKSKARELLGIDQDAKVIIAPGSIRSFGERRMILRSFRSLKMAKKVLIATNMRTELRYDFPGRVRLKKFFDVQNFFKQRFQRKFQPPVYLFNYNPLSKEELSLRVSAADIVLVPRRDLLNSGIVFLGLTFGKIVAGPAIGNIAEQLMELDYPLFDPNSIPSVTNALDQGIKNLETGEYAGKSLAKYQPESVAASYDRLLMKYKTYD